MLPIRKQLIIAVIANLGIGGLAHAQFSGSGPGALTRPPSDLGGYTGRQMNRLYRQSLGNGYSGDSINRMTLNQLASNIGYYGQDRVAQDRGVSSSGLPRTLGSSRAPASKPFSTVAPTPTVSPYLNLFRDTLSDDVLPEYNTFVRPQLQQQSLNQQLQRQTVELERRVQQISAQPAFNPRGSESQAPTGHAAAFNYYGSYYPALSGRRR